MLSNYWSVLYRLLLKNKGFTTINILGLSVGLACCLIIYLFVLDELSYDRFHSKADRIYRIAFSTDESQMMTNANGSFAAVTSMANDFPEVEAFARFRKMGQGTKIMVGYKDRKFYEERFFFADSGVFKLFDFGLLSGNVRSALSEPNTIVITKSMALKYFKTEEPLGKVMTADPYNDGQLLSLKVTGVMEDVPTNSHLKFDFLVSFSSQRDDMTTWFGFDQIYSYVLLSPNTEAASFAEKLKGYSNKYMGENAWYQVTPQPLTDIHLQSQLRSEPEANGSMETLYTFSGIGFIILVIASINFMTLSTARSARRAKEVGVRKSLGANRRELFWQFVNEAFIFVALSTFVAFVLTEFALPALNSFTGKSISLVGSLDASLIFFTLGLVMIITFFAGSYPAVFLSAFEPGQVLKGTAVKRRSLNTFRKGLVVFQFTISIGLIAATLIVRQQLEFARQQTALEKGDQVLIAVLNKQVREKYTTIKEQLSQVAGTTAVAGSSLVPTKGSSTFSFELGAEKKELYPYTYFTDTDINKTYGYEILAGREFGSTYAEDSIFDCIVSREAVREAGYDDPEKILGEVFVIGGGYRGRIIGVMEDFHVYSMKENINPTIFIHFEPSQYQFISVRTSGARVGGLTEKMEELWQLYSPDYPLEYLFLDEGFQQLHDRENKLASLFGIFSLLAIIIACLGLFGLASYTAEQRTKEIGIRKVMGADVWQIVWLLSREFGRLVLLAAVLATPIVWLSMNKWLDDFAYRTSISAWIFLLAGFVGLFIAYFTVSWQSGRVARSNPVTALRHE